MGEKPTPQRKRRAKIAKPGMKAIYVMLPIAVADVVASQADTERRTPGDHLGLLIERHAKGLGLEPKGATESCEREQTTDH